jgi:hypothetical protein
VFSPSSKSILPLSTGDTSAVSQQHVATSDRSARLPITTEIAVAPVAVERQGDDYQQPDAFATAITENGLDNQNQDALSPPFSVHVDSQHYNQIKEDRREQDELLLEDIL